jgi:CBS domain-containing protein
MLKVGDIMTANPITVAPQATLREAVELLATHGISGMPVVAGRRLVGTLSAGDIIDFESTMRGVPTERDNDGLEDLPALTSEDSATEFYVDLWDDAGLDVVERMRCSESPEWDYLSQHLVLEAMSAELTTFGRFELVDDAAEYMRKSGAHSAIVADDGVLVGIVTTMDITRAVAQHRADI